MHVSRRKGRTMTMDITQESHQKWAMPGRGQHACTHYASMPQTRTINPSLLQTSKTQSQQDQTQTTPPALCITCHVHKPQLTLTFHHTCLPKDPWPTTTKPQIYKKQINERPPKVPTVNQKCTHPTESWKVRKRDRETYMI